MNISSASLNILPHTYSGMLEYHNTGLHSGILLGGYMANRYEHTLLGGSGDMHLRYSAAHEQLDSPRVLHASIRTRTRTRGYSRLLKHAHAHARTHARDSRAVDTLARTQALHFLSGWERQWYRCYRYAFVCTACAHYSHTHACDTHCTRMRANIHMQVARASHACVRLSSHSRVDTCGPTSCS